MGIRLTPLNGNAPAPSLSPTESPDVLGAAFRQENDITALIDIVTRDDFQPDPTFDLRSRLETSELFSLSPDSFIGIRSEEEFLYKERKVAQELKDRQLIASAGIGGIAAAVLAGVLSPTVILPAGAAGRGLGALKSARNVASWSVVGAGMQEAVLQSSQELRTGEETALSLGSSIVLGGILGGAIGYLDNAARARLASDMAGITIKQAIPRPVPLASDEGTLSAARVVPDFAQGAGDLAPSFGLTTALRQFNPVLRTFGQDASPTAKWMQASLTTGGLKLEGNYEGIPSARGGSIESRTMVHYGKIAQATRARNEAYARRADLSMSRNDFDEAIGKALRRGGEHADPAVTAAAKAVRESIFRPLFNELREVQFPGFSDTRIPAKLDAEGNVISPAEVIPKFTEEELSTYVHRIYKKNLAKREREQFEGILIEHLKEQLDAKWQKRLDNATRMAAKETENADDLALGPDEIKAAREALEAQMKALPEQFPAEIGGTASEIRDLRSRAKQAGLSAEERKALREEANQLEAENKETLQPFRIAENKLKARFRSLDQTRSALEDAQVRKLDQIQALEDMQLDTLTSVARAGQRLLNKIARLEKDAPAAMERFEAQIEQALRRLEKAELRLSKATNATPEELKALEEAAELRKNQFAEMLYKLEIAKSPEEQIEAVEQLIQETLIRAREVNHKRSIRIEALRQKADSIDPTSAAKRAADLRARAESRIDTVMSAIDQEAGRIVDGKLDMGDLADRLASEISEKLIGDHTRAPGMSLLLERGPELARMLDIDETRVWSNGRSLEDFLENNIDSISRRYVRTVGPDLEIYRTYGTVNPLAADAKGTHKSGAMQQVAKEFKEQREAAYKIEDPKKRQKRLDYLSKTQSEFIRDFDAQLDRLRHIRGIPDDPSSVGFRLGRFLLNVNVLRLMGGMANSSLPDLAGPILKQGLVKTFGDGLSKLATDLPVFKHMKQEAQYAAKAIDLMMHSRSNAMMDIMDDLENNTVVERGMQFATNKMGFITGMDWLNEQTNTFAAVLYNAEIMRGLDSLFNGTPSKHQLAFMADLGIGKNEARLIWEQMQLPGGSTRSDTGVILPNTESWSHSASGREARRVYRAALNAFASKVVVTPGIDRPLWIDSSIAARLISQFRSFTLAATTKILISGAQDLRSGNMAPAVGAIFALALGALSYYTWATARGGKAYDDMKSATREQWADQAIDRSGLLAVFGDLRKLARGNEFTAAFTSVEGASAAGNPRFATPVADQFGPSIDLITNLDKIFRGAGQLEQESEVGAAVRGLMPLQNLLFISRAFDRVQKLTTGGGNDGSLAGF